MTASAHRTLIVAQHERRLDHVRQREHLILAKHELQEREDSLRRRRVGCEGADDAHRKRPRREVLAVVGVEEEDAIGERSGVVVIEGRARALGGGM